MGYFIQQLAVGESFDGRSDGTVIDERRLIAAALLYVDIQCVVASVDHGASEPAIERCARSIEYGVPPLVPVNILGGVGPEGLWVLPPTGVCFVVGVGHRSSRTANAQCLRDNLKRRGQKAGCFTVDLDSDLCVLVRRTRDDPPGQRVMYLFHT